MTESIMLKKSKAFALRIVRLYKYLREHHESVIAKQMLRSGTSIGANIAESRYAQSKADFASKLQIALKEASETEYWLELLRDAELVVTVDAFGRYVYQQDGQTYSSPTAIARMITGTHCSGRKFFGIEA